MLYCLFIWVVKAAVLIQVILIFTPNKSGRVYWTIYALIWGNLALYTGLLFAITLECSPEDKIWNLYITIGTCLERNVLLLVTGLVKL